MEQSKRINIDKRKKRNYWTGLLTVLLVMGLAFAACDAPAGAEGPQGPEGPAGPVGPAGEDGSVMYAGKGAPADDVADIGDYYLNQNTGELYGPKDSDGWGDPIIVLMGDDGQDGADGLDGTDGQDGEDGSQIYSGTGAPDASLGVEGDYYLDKSSYELYGPKTDSGWGTPLNLKGADGNANVTRYLFPGHNFSQEDRFYDSISLDSRAEMRESAWLTYLIYENKSTNTVLHYYSMPGYGRNNFTSYSANHYHSDFGNDRVFHNVYRVDGTGEAYDQIEVIRIEATNTVDNRGKKAGASIIPDHLDTSDYQAVAEYYGFSTEQ